MSKPSTKSSNVKSIIAKHDANSSLSDLYEDILELILLCTVNDVPSSLPSSCIYLTELMAMYPERWNTAQVDRALLERLSMSKPSNHLMTSSATKSSINNDTITENRCLYYLSGCYQRLLKKQGHFKEIMNEIQKIFIDYSKTAILLPRIYEGQDIFKQWMELLIESQNDSSLCEYTDRINNELLSEFSDEVETLYKNVFDYMHKLIQPLDYYSNELISYIAVLNRLAKWPILVKMMFRFSYPNKSSDRSSQNSSGSISIGREFEDTLIGSLLSKSCLPSTPGKPYIFFHNPTLMNEKLRESTAVTMWQPIKAYQENLSQLFKTFVKNAEARNDVLKWIGDCFDQNQAKFEDWSSNDPITALLFVSDGFSLNLNVILLDLAKPFCEPYSPKLLKINPIYAITENENVHLKNLARNKSLIARNKDTENDGDSQITFNFITEIFFMSHFSYSCSVIRLKRKLGKVGEEFSRIRNDYNAAVQLSGSSSERAKELHVQLEKSLTEFLNIRTVLTEPYLLELSNALLASTCSWLVHLASITSNHHQDRSEGEEQINMIKKLPLSCEPNPQLSYIPEFILENIIHYVKFLSQFNKQSFRFMDSSINVYVNLVLVFMGDRSRLHNPHLRATLADVFAVFLPEKGSDDDDDDDNRAVNQCFAETIFQENPLIEHLPRALLDVFVSIELTGQAVAFAEKFNYRRPMYDILEYLWKFDKYRIQFQKLASYAERHIDDAEAPLFLRFINLLMNDANYLLDEALTHMTRLRADQDIKEGQEWDRMPEMQRQEVENTFQRNGQMARYMNIMGFRTLTILAMITQYIKSIFCHPSICGRLASILDYILQHLVGPKRRNLKVRDLKEYSFDPPKFVAQVTDIYLNFTECSQFHEGVSNDAMSYNERLFPEAVEVLKRINYPPERIHEFLKLGECIKITAAEQKDQDAAYDDAPDDYLDPITSILMVDPVMLPSSRKILDRSTIARHLLSDQTDPFNRNSLRMQDVISQNELKQTIEQWKASRSQ